MNRRKLFDPRTYTRVKRNNKKKAATDKNKTKRRNKTEIFLESLKQSYTSYKRYGQTDA